jgi:hypothetical protein
MSGNSNSKTAMLNRQLRALGLKNAVASADADVAMSRARQAHARAAAKKQVMGNA